MHETARGELWNRSDRISEPPGRCWPLGRLGPQLFYNGRMVFVDGATTFSSRAAFVQISAEDQLGAALKALGLRPDHPTLVLVGGAGGMSAGAIGQIGTFFEHLLIPFIDRHQIAVLDGGTNTGIMEALGQARTRHAAQFPLIGVLVEKLARQAPEMLQKDHTHFILTPGSDWGDEVPWLSLLASALAGEAPSLTLLINGGTIAWKDAVESVAAKRPVLVAEGTGRTADEISRTSTGRSLNQRAVKLLKSGLVFVTDPYKEPDQFMRRLRGIYEKPWKES